MYFAIDTERVRNDLMRLASLVRRFDEIHGKYVSLSRKIDFEVRNREAVRIALKNLESDMECIRNALRKMQGISDAILAEYTGANRANLKECGSLVTETGAMVQGTGAYDGMSGNYSFGEYIRQINKELNIPVGVMSPIDAEILQRHGIRTTEADIDGNVPVPAWKAPEFK